MSVRLRVAYLAAAVLLLLLLPLGSGSVLLTLFVAVDLAAAALMLRHVMPRPARKIVPVAADPATLPLLRRTVPALRMRRPAVIIEAQIRWRIAAAARRQLRVIR